ncbi:hypothetical protein I7I51_00162 [Histoplasma capsulatum]|uniref:RNase H type-1 domain-containing protein n=1 Tax=Ajellomyces capsulatus TaxID=5037 RepID=A0A8A1MBA5_AJECA|nr:hypothetical protein I7I51_00162 [Histoplasma capsulatum]
MAVDAEAHLLLVQQQLEQTTLEAMMRMRTSPPHNDMAVISGDNERPPRKRDALTPLDRFSGILEDKFKLQPSSKEAIKEHDITEPETVRIYNDGSSINDHVRAAATSPSLQNHSARRKQTQYMGQSSTSTVYAAELKGLVLALRLMLDTHTVGKTTRKYAIVTDNQAAISAIQNPTIHQPRMS